MARPVNPAPETIDEVVRLYESGVTQTKLADLYDVTQPTIKRWLERGTGEKIPGRGRGKRINPGKDLLDEVAELYSNGMSKRALSRKYKVSDTTIKKWIDEQTGAKEKARQERDRTIKELHEKGLTPAQICKGLGLSQSTTYRVLGIVGEDYAAKVEATREWAAAFAREWDEACRRLQGGKRNEILVGDSYRECKHPHEAVKTGR